VDREPNPADLVVTGGLYPVGCHVALSLNLDLAPQLGHFIRTV